MKNLFPKFRNDIKIIKRSTVRFTALSHAFFLLKKEKKNSDPKLTRFQSNEIKIQTNKQISKTNLLFFKHFV